MASKEHYQLNKERIKQQSKEYYYAHRDAQLLAQQAFRKANPRKVKAQNIRAKHGISLDEYETRFFTQEGKCEICGLQMILGRNSHLDHDHVTGKRRDFLCESCNKGLGRFKDSPELLRAAAEYLIKHKEKE